MAESARSRARRVIHIGVICSEIYSFLPHEHITLLFTNMILLDAPTSLMPPLLRQLLNYLQTYWIYTKIIATFGPLLSGPTSTVQWGPTMTARFVTCRSLGLRPLAVAYWAQPPGVDFCCYDDWRTGSCLTWWHLSLL